MAFKLYFAGGEAPSWRKLLTESGAKHIGLSYTNLVPRLPKTKPYLLAERFPQDVDILVDSGAFATKTKVIDHELHIVNYTQFVQQNVDRLTLVTEYDPVGQSLTWVERWRTEFWDTLPPEKFMPIWHETHGLPELERLCEKYDHVGITKTDRNLVARLNALTQRYGVALHGVAITRPEELEQVRFASAMSTSWISPMKYGETHVWDGHRLRWYPVRYKSQARKRHRMLFTRYGFDAEAIAEDNNAEVARFTVWSWLQLEEAMGTKRIRRIPRADSTAPVATTEPDEDEEEFAQTAPTALANGSHQQRNAELVLRDERVTLPVMQFESRIVTNQEGQEVEARVASLSRVSFRRCDSCYISASCPAFEPNSECKYDLPIEIRTKDQLMAACTALLEMQIQRIAFARFAEENEGGYPDPNLSSELDRFMTMTTRFKDIQDNRDFMRVTVEARGNAGVLSALFGDHAGEQARRLERPLDGRATDKFVADFVGQDTDIAEAEIIN